MHENIKPEEHTKKLFVIYIGGAHDKSLIELHDIRFVVSDIIENTYDALRNSWWGKPGSLHLDAWGALTWADGHRVVIGNTTLGNNRKQLYFINLGGYDSKQFTELHKNVFIVAENNNQAKIKALKQVLYWEAYHRDYQYEIENIISVSELINEKKHFLCLVPHEEEIPFKFICKYINIGKA